MIKVMHLVLNLNVGGLERFIIELIKNYSKNITPYIVCLEEEGELAKFVKGANVIELNKKPGMQLHIIQKIMNITNQYGIQIIHTHNEGAHFYGSVAGFLSHIPVIHTRHGRYLHHSRKKIILNMISSLLSTKVIGVSQDVSDLIRKTEHIPNNKVLTVLNGVDVNIYSPHLVKNLLFNNDIRDKYTIIGIVARLDVVKDHLNLLKACKVLTGYTDKFMLIIVGDGPLRAKLEIDMQNLELQDRVLFTGTRNDIPDILNILDIYVLSSTSEGTSMTLLESMSSCLPVVATDVGGNSEVVIDCETGFLVPPNGPELFAEKLLILIRNSKLRAKMGNAGRERVRHFFNITDTAKKYEQIYHEAHSGKKA